MQQSSPLSPTTCRVNALPLIIFLFFFFIVFRQIATQIAVLIAKVARLDCPRQWPELIPILLESVKGHDGLQQHRALLTFYHVTKTLASKCLTQDKRFFQDVSPAFCSLVSCYFLTLSLSFNYPYIAFVVSCTRYNSSAHLYKSDSRSTSEEKLKN